MSLGIGQSYSEQKFGGGKSTNPAHTGERTDKLEFEKLYAYHDTTKKNIADWVWEYQSASNYGYYKTTSNKLDYRDKLVDLYDHCMLDLHLTSVVDSLFHQIIGERYTIKNADGSTNEDATKLIKKSWFVTYIRQVIESKLYGYSLVELGDKDERSGSLEEVTAMPRRNIAPKDNLVLEYPRDTVGWDITSDELKEDYIMIDGQEGFGWLVKAVPIILSKRFALSAHTQYAETYGIPMIVGKTTDESFEEKKALANEIAQARDSRVIITGVEDDVTFLNQISNDTNKIFTELVRLTNDEITMLILGQSATTESQAYVGSAEIQYRVMVDRVEAIREFVANHINEELMWRLQYKGLDIPEGCYFQYSNVMEMSPESKRDLFQTLLGSYEISSEEIYDTFGVTVGRQILEESNDQLLTYGEETVKERGNPDEATPKDAQTAKNIQREQTREENLEEEFPELNAGINFFDTVDGCDFDLSASCMEKDLIKLNSKELSASKIVNTITKLYSSHHSHEIDVEASLKDDEDAFLSILSGLYSRIFAGDESAVNEAIQELAQTQYNILAEIFRVEYGASLEDLSRDPSEEGYKESVSNFFATFSTSKQFQLLKIISSLASLYQGDYQTFVMESNKAVSLFNKTYHVVEGDAMQVGYSFAKVWRGESDDQVIFEYGTAGDDRVRPDHRALEGIRMRKSEWANSSFLPPWAYGCRCYLFNTGTTDGRQLTNSRKMPKESAVPKEFRTNAGESGAVFSRQHPYYEDLSQGDATIIRRIIQDLEK